MSILLFVFSFLFPTTLNAIKSFIICQHFIWGDDMKRLFITTPKRLVYLLSFIYILNCIDLLFTYTYMKLGGFYEVNPVMRQLIWNPYLSILSKIIFPGLLIGYLCTQIDKVALTKYRIYHLGMLLLFLIYIAIIALHLYYLFFCILF